MTIVQLFLGEWNRKSYSHSGDEVLVRLAIENKSVDEPDSIRVRVQIEAEDEWKPVCMRISVGDVVLSADCHQRAGLAVL